MFSHKSIIENSGGVMLMNEELIKVLLDRGNTFAVIGASRDPQKYGYQVYKDLKNAGYKVFAVNPHADKILGDKCYPSLETLPVKPDVVNTVVPPKITDHIVETCKKLGITRVWMQPGSESDKAIEFCKENGISVVYGVCIMIERAKHGVSSQENTKSEGEDTHQEGDRSEK
ncbi:MAG: CoA-binding protein [Methanomassiliicoccales archaeon]